MSLFHMPGQMVLIVKISIHRLDPRCLINAHHKCGNLVQIERMRDY